MNKSLHKVLFLTVATTALSIIPGSASDLEMTSSSGGRARAIHSGNSMDSSRLGTADTTMPAATPRSAPVVPVAGCCGCWSGFFSKRTFKAAGDILDHLGGLAQVGLEVAATVKHDKKLEQAAAGIRAGRGVVHRLEEGLSGPDGLTVGAAVTALRDVGKGVGEIASVSAPGSKGARVAQGVGDRVTSVAEALGAGKQPATLRVGLEIGGGPSGGLAEDVSGAAARVTSAQMSVGSAVDAANPLPGTASAL